MALSKREKTIVAVTAAVLGLLGLDRYALRPYLESRDRLETRQVALERQISEARQTFVASERANRRWAQFRAGGLQTDASATENNLLNAMRSWSQASRLPLASIRPDRMATAHGLQEMTFQATAQGSMRTIGSFLFHAETTDQPMRVRELQIASRADGTDDLSMQMRVSTLWEDPALRQGAAVPTQGMARANP